MGLTAKTFVVVVFTLSISTFGAADTCNRVATCKCSTQGGIVIDLNNLKGDANPKFNATDPVTKSIYYYSPCVPLIEASCNQKFEKLSLSFCQFIPVTGDVFDAGDYSTEVFTGDPTAGTLTVTYTGVSKDLTRTSQVKLICSTESSLRFVKEDPPFSGHYFFDLRTPVACPEKPDSGGLSTGSILVILFFVFILVYWIGGFVFLKFVRRAEGLEAVPNYEFWKELPSLIRDGVNFTLRGCKGESTYEKI